MLASTVLASFPREAAAGIEAVLLPSCPPASHHSALLLTPLEPGEVLDPLSQLLQLVRTGPTYLFLCPKVKLSSLLQVARGPYFPHSCSIPCEGGSKATPLLSDSQDQLTCAPTSRFNSSGTLHSCFIFSFLINSFCPHPIHFPPLYIDPLPL